MEDASAEEVAEVVIDSVFRAEERTPAAAGVGGVESLRAAYVFFLQLRSTSHIRHFEACAGSDGNGAFFAALGGNQDDTVGTFLTIKS